MRPLSLCCIIVTALEQLANFQSERSPIKGVSGRRWQLTAQQLHARNESRQYVEGWNYTVNVGPGGVSQISASKVQGNITATYSGRLNVTVDSGASFSVPVSGQFQGLSTTPVVSHFSGRLRWTLLGGRLLDCIFLLTSVRDYVARTD